MLRGDGRGGGGSWRSGRRWSSGHSGRGGWRRCRIGQIDGDEIVGQAAPIDGDSRIDRDRDPALAHSLELDPTGRMAGLIIIIVSDHLAGSVHNA